MKYYEALMQLDNGESICRRSWEDKDKFISLDPGSTDANRGIQPKFMYYIDEAGNRHTFEPTSDDQMAEDWELFGYEKDKAVQDYLDAQKAKEPSAPVSSGPVSPLSDPEADKKASRRPLASAKKEQTVPARSSVPVKDEKNGDDEGVVH